MTYLFRVRSSKHGRLWHLTPNGGRSTLCGINSNTWKLLENVQGVTARELCGTCLKVAGRTNPTIIKQTEGAHHGEETVQEEEAAVAQEEGDAVAGRDRGEGRPRIE